jgi:hypothetical protein
MQAGSAIATFSGFARKELAFWSPAEAKFLLLLTKWINGKHYADDWFSLDKDGHIEQLTRFADMSARASIYSSSLSPDGEAIAFWLQIDQQEERDLLVLNVKTRQVTKYSFKVPASGLWSKASWSLDGHFLIMTADNPERTEANNEVAYISYLVNLQQNWIVQIAKSDDFPIGFAVEP